MLKNPTMDDGQSSALATSVVTVVVVAVVEVVDVDEVLVVVSQSATWSAQQSPYSEHSSSQ